MQILNAQCSFPRYMLTQPDRFDVALLHLDRPVFYQVPFHFVPFFFTSLRPRLSENVFLVLGNQSIQIVRNLSYKSFINELDQC